MKHEHISPKKMQKQRPETFLTLTNFPPSPGNFSLVKCLLRKLLEGLAPGLLCGEAAGARPHPAGRRCLLQGCGGDSARAGDRSHLHPWTSPALVCPARDIAAGEPGTEGTRAVSWDGTWEAAEGEGQEGQGTFLARGSASGLSRLYQRVIKRRSAGLRFGNRSISAQKQPGEMNLGPT